MATLDEMCKQEIWEIHLLRTTRNFDLEFAQGAMQNAPGTVLQTNKAQNIVRNDHMEDRGPYIFGHISMILHLRRQLEISSAIQVDSRLRRILPISPS